MIVGVIYVPGPTATCPIEGCGIDVVVVIRKRRCVQMGGCSHLVSIEQVGTRIMVGYADDIEDTITPR